MMQPEYSERHGPPDVWAKIEEDLRYDAVMACRAYNNSLKDPLLNDSPQLMGFMHACLYSYWAVCDEDYYLSMPRN